MKDLNEIRKDLAEYRYAEVADGVYVSTRESIEAEKAEWSENDPALKMNFSKAPYWITTDNGVTPIAIYDLSELSKLLP